MIDWSKLKPYKNDKRKSFEELCYQIAKTLYSNKGSFTSIDDSGGGDGVEFFITLPNGDEWGWQAKFYYPSPRFDESNRKKQIIDSLRTSCKKHPKLKKWFLCTPTNLTENERKWFNETLINDIPPNMELKLIHWGDRDFNNWLRKLPFQGIRKYFFGELELNFEWFKNQVDKHLSSVKDKFEPDLHTETDVEKEIHSLICDKKFITEIRQGVEELEKRIKILQEIVAKTENISSESNSLKDLSIKVLSCSKELVKDFHCIRLKIKGVCNLLENGKFNSNNINWDDIEKKLECRYGDFRKCLEDFEEAKIEIEEKYKDLLKKFERKFIEIEKEVYNLSEYIPELINCFYCTKQKHLHILGDAGVGKTHIVSAISNDRIENGLPALILFGISFNSNDPIERQIINILDIPRSYSWHDFLQALSSAAEAYKTKIPIIIDGLNEAIVNGRLFQKWKSELVKIITEISNTKNIVLVTTCRSTYKEAVGLDKQYRNCVQLKGFDFDKIEFVVKKYFDFYKIKADPTTSSLDQFKHPIYLKIFCESKNPQRKNEKNIYIGESTLFEVFEKYLNQINKSICNRLGLHTNVALVSKSLDKMARYIWKKRKREIPLEELVKLVDDTQFDTCNWDESKTKMLLDEGLLLSRDYKKSGEFISFTYDLLGGYLIARNLIRDNENKIEDFFKSQNICDLLFSFDFKKIHPLYNDINRCLAAILPSEKSIFLHDILDNKEAFKYSIDALFEISPSAINNDCKKIVSRLFRNAKNRKYLLKRSAYTIGNVAHPFNASFWSEQILKLTMPERDISWTEYVREENYRLSKFVKQFENTCKSNEFLSELTQNGLHLFAEHIMWMLTTTIRKFRDDVTRALYWYGRKYPIELFKLVKYSLEINDPYISERMLAAIYGISMARQYDFKDNSFSRDCLPLIGKELYNAMFKTKAPYATTHVLSRDYARRTIEIALNHHPELLNKKQINRIKPPYKDGGIRNWKQSKDIDEKEYRDVIAPIQMDFGNYTLGRLVRNRRNYDFDNKEYKKVRANIIWRMFELGYSLEAFGELDSLIFKENWHIGRSGNGRKMERYGKKYSWIAFYELAGYRDDKGLLDEYNKGREITDNDIDPSFPIEPHRYDLIEKDFLGDRGVPVEKWIETDDIPDIESYLKIDELWNERGPWVLLDGYVRQEDRSANRDFFIFIRGLLIDKKETKQILDLLNKSDFTREIRLPGSKEDYYIYAGEIPCSDNYPLNGKSPLSIPVDNGAFPIKYKDYNVLVPVRESHATPAKEIVNQFDLCGQPQTYDFFEKNGKRASITIKYGDDYHSVQRLTFLRFDLFEKFIQKTGNSFIWAIWGERKSIPKEISQDDYPYAYKTFQEVKEFKK